MSVAGLVLTGGASRRLGVDKATLVLDGETLAGRAARVLSARCARVLEVGPGVTELHAVRETPAGAGPLAALAAGSATLAASGAITSVVLLACDLPWVEPVLDALVAAALDELPTIVAIVPVDGEGRRQYVCARYGPSALLRASTLVAAGERSLRGLVESFPSDAIMELEGFAAGAFADIDGPDDARAAGIDLRR